MRLYTLVYAFLPNQRNLDPQYADKEKVSRKDAVIKNK
jgi:hypothetical protein